MSQSIEADKQAGLSFEDAYAQLEDVVRKLESKTLSLDESLELFERGQRLVAYCHTRLDEAELKIQRLAAGPDGAAVLAPWAGDESD